MSVVQRSRKAFRKNSRVKLIKVQNSIEFYHECLIAICVFIICNGRGILPIKFSGGCFFSKDTKNVTWGKNSLLLLF